LKHILRDVLPVSAVFLVLLSMISVDIVIINEPLRTVSIVPMVLIILIWLAAVVKLRRGTNVR
jgi:hypothetical protein